MKRWIKHIAITVAIIVVVLLALPFLVYVPPVQKWLVDKVTAVASEATGFDISVGGVSFRFPLTLSLEDVVVTRSSEKTGCCDTIADIASIEASMAMLPLFSLRAEVGGLNISDARLNTYDLISDTQLKGNIGRLAVGSTIADINAGTVDVSLLRLADADICVYLSDTAAVDTTESEALPWFVALREATLSNVFCEVHLPGDSIIAASTLAKAVATDAGIDLLHEHYSLATLHIDQTTFSFDKPFESLVEQPLGTPAIDGLLMDYSHLAFSDLALSIDSFVYNSLSSDSFLSFNIPHASMKERCGFQISDLSASVALDSLGIRLPVLSLSTPSSSLFGKASIDYAALDSSALASPYVKERTIAVELDASLSRHDLAHFHPVKSLPQWPLAIRAKGYGNIAAVNVELLTLDLPTVFQAEASGSIEFPSIVHVPIEERFGQSSLDFQLTLQNASFLFATLGIDSKSFSLPPNFRLGGNVTSSGLQYDATLAVHDGSASVAVRAFLDAQAEAYSADIELADLSVGQYVPAVDGFLHKAVVTARGQGFDIYNRKTLVEADATLDSLTYEQWQVDSIHLAATIENTLTTANIAMENIHGRDISGKGFDIDFNGNIKAETNFKDSHKMSGLLKDFVISDSTGIYHPENLGVLLALRPDTTYARIQNGNFIMKMDASGPYDNLLDKLTALNDTINQQIDKRVIDQSRLRQMLPSLRLYVTSGRENVVAKFLRASRNIDYKEILADINMSASKGINGQMYIHNLGLGTTRIDTTRVILSDTRHGFTFQARVANEKKNPLVFTALMDGHLYEHGARMGLRIFDREGRQGLRIGTQASMDVEGMRFNLLPRNPIIAYREFKLNENNFIFLRNDMHLSAMVEMEDGEGTVIDVYSEEADSTRLQDLTVSTANLNLKQLTSALPFLPSIEGMFGGDFHIIMDQQKQISVASDIEVDNMIYEGNTIGDLNTEFVYLQNTDNTHAIDGILLRDGKQIASLSGSYINKKVSDGNEYLDGKLELEKTPLDLANGFITDRICGLEGFANGALTMKGPLDALIVDGRVSLDSAVLFSTPYGVRMGIDDKPIEITHSKLILENFKIYESPLNEKRKASSDTVAYVTITGNADFTPDTPASVDFRVRARELQIINSKQMQGSLLYGKGFVSILAMVRGPLDKMTVRGRFNVLGNTDITYLLLDSPLSTDNQMDELVKFIDFTDSTQTVVQRPIPSGIDLNMVMSIDQGAHIKCGLNADQSNYVDIYGGGDLRLRMSQTEEMSLTGRYTLTSGTMKYSLPVIPLKTFTIQDGSYVEFTGSPYDPTLNITATERNRASVGQEGTQSRIVAFDCGVVVTKTLSNMGLQFVISAPEDIGVQSELQAMTVEQRGKLAVTMLTTGMYLADGNTSGFTMNSALSSFLQSEINNIAGNALSTLDVSVGVDNTTDASGNMHTDYSFQFAKRFWNNRLKVQIGGKVSSGQEAQGEKQSFFDNVSMEYRLTPTSNQYLKLFYKQNVYDWLDGYTGEYGAGYIYKRKMDHWWDIFRLWGKEQRNR